MENKGSEQKRTEYVFYYPNGEPIKRGIHFLLQSRLSLFEQGHWLGR